MVTYHCTEKVRKIGHQIESLHWRSRKAQRTPQTTVNQQTYVTSYNVHPRRSQSVIANSDIRPWPLNLTKIGSRWNSNLTSRSKVIQLRSYSPGTQTECPESRTHIQRSGCFTGPLTWHGPGKAATSLYVCVTLRALCLCARRVTSELNHRWSGYQLAVKSGCSLNKLLTRLPDSVHMFVSVSCTTSDYTAPARLQKTYT